MSRKEKLFEPTTPNASPVWMEGPNIRSSFDLISSCVLTLLLCVWTAVHLNIPRYDRRTWRHAWFVHFYTKFVFMFLGLVAPEVVLYSAWTQYIQARRVLVGLKRVEEEKTRSEKVTVEPEAETHYPHDDDNHEEDAQSVRLSLMNPNAKSPSRFSRFMEWVSPSELERGFYVCMGGFEVKVGTTPAGVNIIKTITPSGAILLSRLGLLPRITVEQINDKSKSDLLTKSLVCIQASWMVVQAVARKFNGLPVTLLELNTVMHVACALLMYLLWLKKPQDVGIPTLILDKSQTKSLGAVLSIKKVHVNKPTIPPSKNGIPIPVVEWVNEGFLWVQGGPREQEGLDNLQVWSEDVIDPQDPNPSKRVQYLWITFRHGFGVENTTYLEFAADNTLTEADALFLVRYCKGAIATFGKQSLQVDWHTLATEIQHNGSFGCTKEASNLDLVGKIRSGDGAGQYAGFVATILFPAIYGGFHLSPWNGHFPTYLERYLWRFCGVSIAIGVPTLFTLSAIVETLFGTQNPFKIPVRAMRWCWGLRLKDSVGKNLVVVPLLLAMGVVVGTVVGLFELSVILLGCMYPLTRVYLLVEAFASLRSLPDGAYKTVDWVEMWPHW